MLRAQIDRWLDEYKYGACNLVPTLCLISCPELPLESLQSLCPMLFRGVALSPLQHRAG